MKNRRYELQQLTGLRNMGTGEPVVERVLFTNDNYMNICCYVAKQPLPGRNRVYDKHSGESINIETAINLGEGSASLDEFIEWGDVPIEFAKKAGPGARRI